jgi:hypothetical protein
MGDEKIVEQITDAMIGYFDFGEGMQDAEWEAGYHVSQHIGKKLPGSLVIGPEDVAALRRVLQAYKAATDALNILWEGTANASDAHDDRRLAALIGDDNG